MQYLTLDTAVPVNEDTGEYQKTARGRKFSHTWGYGKVDSLALVEAAKVWKNVKPQAWYYSPWIHVNQEIPQGRDGLAVSFDVTPDMLKEANVETVEHVTVTMNVNHTRRGDISVDLISPFGVVSHISTARKQDSAPTGYNDWTFMSVAHWGESGVGTWSIIIRDTVDNEHQGTFVDWHLKLWGESIDADKAVLLPMPEESDDDDHTLTATTTATASTHKIPAPTDGAHSTDTASATPTDGPHRPTKIQPSNGSPTSTDAASSTTTL
jgi:kexin